MPLNNRLSMIPIMEKTRGPKSLSVAEAADTAFKARLERAELEEQIRTKYEAERKRREIEAAEEEKLLKRIEAQREKERKAYLQEIAAIEKQSKIKDETRLRQEEITRRLEEIRIDEARQKDIETATQKRLLLEYDRDYINRQQRFSAISSNYYRRPFISGSVSSDYLEWFYTWQASLQQIYLQAPLSHLREINRCLDAESIKLREIIRQRFARET